jgi:hypothetical protein
MSHKAIRPTRNGYGKVLEQCIFSSKKLFCRLRTMAGPRDPFRIAFLQRIPAEVKGRPRKDVRQELENIRKWFVGKSNPEIVDGGHYDLFKELGSDQTILSWAVNFKNEDGSWNQDIDLMNELNGALYSTFSMMPIPAKKGSNNKKGRDKLKKPSDVKLIITASSFGVSAYGSEFVRSFLSRAEVKVSRARVTAPDFQEVSFNISTQMDPWFTELPGNPQDGFLETIEETIRAEILKQVEVLHRKARRAK